MSPKFLLLIGIILLVGYVNSQEEEPAEGSLESDDEAGSGDTEESSESDEESEESDSSEEDNYEGENSVIPVQNRVSYPGIIPILGAGGTVLEAFVSFLIGKGSFDDVKCSLEGVMMQVSRMVSVSGAVGLIPLWGYVLQPLVEALARILKEIPFLGPVLSFLLVGVTL
ncbi:unnamed protein product [Phyllotreta striolata]|uniref:Uncharacterized protein n=1 Tax=Phyllotreta striolata TaxID=444603 RepID=A0A9N9XQX4_PHYSR|nr:unnamed protein product [Phyllotreta striolata]